MSDSPAYWLAPPVQGGRDHCLGADGADITLVEYGSFDCPYCQGAHAVIANLRDRFGERLRYVFRHRPITGDTKARAAAELVEYAHESAGEYWQAHDTLMKLGPQLTDADLEALETRMSLPTRDGGGEAAWQLAQRKVAEDVESAAASGALVSPTFFINGRRYEGPWDESSLAEALSGSLGHRMQSAALDFARWAPSTGLLLLAMTLAAVGIANSPFASAAERFWAMPIGLTLGEVATSLPLRGIVNDGLLTLFFLVVGLEIKREVTVGRLASRRAAALPVAAAIGGMLVPALIYLALAPPGAAAGWAIPTTTDTAFAVALVALLGARVPVELRIFLTAAVIVDDLVAIAVVAIFYSAHFDAGYAAASAGLAVLLVLVNRAGIYRALPYALLGVMLWICLHRSGLHPTLAGVILALVTPTRPPANLEALVAQAESVIDAELGRTGERVLKHGPSEPALRQLDAIHDRIESPADKLLRSVEPWSSYLILPVFALANAGLALSMGLIEGHARLALAVAAALVLGKPLGMLLGAASAVRLGVAVKPGAYSWRQLGGAATLAGIGFTMSLYIADKAFADPGDFAAAKLGVFIASLAAGAAGVALLRRESARDRTRAASA
jgi:NhaA family Na+:H+ antiporter